MTDENPLAGTGFVLTPAMRKILDSIHDTEPGTPNLDCMDAGDLSAFAVACYSNPLAEALRARYYPERPMTKSMLRVIHSLGRYAAQQVFARKRRLEGNIQMAKFYESECETLYRALPKWAKW